MSVSMIKIKTAHLSLLAIRNVIRQYLFKDRKGK